MNVLEGLQLIRGRLVANGAQPATLQMVDGIIRRAALPAAASAAAQSQSQLVRMLMRQPATDANVEIYNDLARLEEDLNVATSARRAEQALEDARPVPKTKKYYKDLKAKQP
ncbi:MAG: hypothetical protein AVDCRST_MAG49-4443 [uncultured Thermomicrobiales bacterium]|uniref:Uncharacterized protein n=1 Tax=uncultured Thermomicrobiales bacterium TaxID=1645740 RepID=A0A6J4VFM8_9BACT|nr:MAG: hypothetical protein AVDCRST_MAG49-4443 [uncultured Thermomicrobiales bacterium]